MRLWCAWVMISSPPVLQSSRTLRTCSFHFSSLSTNPPYTTLTLTAPRPQKVVAAARDPTRRPVFVFGEPGLMKDNVAALVHFGAGKSRGPLIEVRGGGWGGWGVRWFHGAGVGFCFWFGGAALCCDSVGLQPANQEYPPTPRQHPQVDCANKPGDSLLAELCGRGSREGLLYWIGEGGIILNNVHQVGAFASWCHRDHHTPLALIISLSPEKCPTQLHMLPQVCTTNTSDTPPHNPHPPQAPPSAIFQISLLLSEGTFQPLPSAWTTMASVDLPRPPQKCAARIFLTAEKRVPGLESLVTTLQVPPLRVRPADILDLQRCASFVWLFCVVGLVCVCARPGSVFYSSHGLAFLRGRRSILHHVSILNRFQQPTPNRSSSPPPPKRLLTPRWFLKDIARTTGAKLALTPDAERQLQVTTGLVTRP